MPAKGQSCLTCNGVCCHRIVGYKYTPDGLAKQTARVARGETEWSKRDVMTYSHKELLNFGMIEIKLPYQKKGCRHLTEDGKCGVEHHKPRLCRTYWCHGRLWEPHND